MKNDSTSFSYDEHKKRADKLVAARQRHATATGISKIIANMRVNDASSDMHSHLWHAKQFLAENPAYVADMYEDAKRGMQAELDARENKELTATLHEMYQELDALFSKAAQAVDFYNLTPKEQSLFIYDFLSRADVRELTPYIVHNEDQGTIDIHGFSTATDYLVSIKTYNRVLLPMTFRFHGPESEKPGFVTYSLRTEAESNANDNTYPEYSKIIYISPAHGDYRSLAECAYAYTVKRAIGSASDINKQESDSDLTLVPTDGEVTSYRKTDYEHMPAGVKIYKKGKQVDTSLPFESLPSKVSVGLLGQFDKMPFGVIYTHSYRS